jgi:drug/metabolite transporter (DMT)-like permease
MRPEQVIEEEAPVEEQAAPGPAAAERPQPRVAAFPWEAAALGAIVLASCGHLMIKAGLRSVALTTPAGGILVRILHYLVQPAVATGLGIYGIGTIMWVYAVSRRSISFLYPLTALNYAIVTMGGKFLFGESISAGRWVGIGVVMLGVALMQLSINKEQA